MGFTQLSWVTLIRLTRGGEVGGERRGRRVGTGFAPNLSASSPDTNRVSKHRGDHVSRKQWCNSQRVNKWLRVQRGRHFWCNSPSAEGGGGSCLGCVRHVGEGLSMFRQTLRFSSLSYIIIPGMKVCTGTSASDESEVVPCSTVFSGFIPSACVANSIKCE